MFTRSFPALNLFVKVVASEIVTCYSGINEWFENFPAAFRFVF